MTLHLRCKLIRSNRQIPEVSLVNEGAIVKFIEDEFRARQQAAMKDYVQIAEKIQKELDESHQHREELTAQITDLLTTIDLLRSANQSLEREYIRLETNYNYVMLDLENKNNQTKDLENGHKELNYKKKEIEKNFERQLKSLTEEHEKKIRELINSEQALRKERDELLMRVRDALTSKMSDEEYQKHQKNQLSQLTVNYTRVSEENEKLKRKVELLLEDKRNLSNMLDRANKDLSHIREEFHIEKDKIIATYENKLKQKDIEFDARPRGPTMTINRATRISELGFLNIPDMDHNLAFAIPHPYNRPTDFVFIEPSSRNVPLPADLTPKEESRNSKMFIAEPELQFSFTDVMNDINYLVSLSGSNQ